MVLLGLLDSLDYGLRALFFDPSLELPDSFTLHRQLDMRVGRVDSRAGGMAHERHAYFLHDTGLHQPSVKGMAEIMETKVADPRVSEKRFPRRFDDPDRSALKLNDKAFGLAFG